MREKNILELQNGSDIRGVALPLFDHEPVNLTEENIKNIALGFLNLVSKKENLPTDRLTIAIGRDSRLSGENISRILVNTLNEQGVMTLDAGLASTPAMFMATIFEEYKANASIMITASHLPKNRNGFKFFDKKGGFDKQDIGNILEYALELENKTKSLDKNLPITKTKKQKKIGYNKQIPLMTTYSNHLKNIIKSELKDENLDEKLPLRELKITVDAGNGAGGFFAKEVLAPLGADISSSQFLEPNGDFPNHAPNPENKEAINSICNRVKESKSDLGIIFDTDVDRASAVDETGKEINRNKIIALSSLLIAEDNPNSVIVTDSVTSTHLTKFLEADLGLKHLSFKRGYKNVINKSKELLQTGINSPLAIETSGHAAFKENYFLDDGAYLATKIVIRTAKLKNSNKNISSCLKSLTEPVEEKELRIKITSENFSQLGDLVLTDLQTFLQNHQDASLTGISLNEPNYEGVRINFDKNKGNGWLLLRKSLHDPILALNVESNDIGGVDKILDFILNFLKNYEGLDLSIFY